MFHRKPSGRQLLVSLMSAAATVALLTAPAAAQTTPADGRLDTIIISTGRPTDPAASIYLENTAGGDHAMARRWETLARLWDVIGNDPRIGFCLDTCHTHAAGEDLADSVDRIVAITGRIDLIHCNGSRDDEGSGRDRHQNFSVVGTDNQISPRTLLDIVRKADAPVICETPDLGLANDVAFLRSALAELG